MKFFCKAGPINPQKHYNLPPLSRINLKKFWQLIDQEKYFVLHAPRQTGKTSLLLALTQQINLENNYTALYVNVEPGQAMRGNIKEGLRIILDRFKLEITRQLPTNKAGLMFFEQGFINEVVPGNELAAFLQFWSQHNEKPLVIFLDEIDTLIGDTLISVLRQIRAGYSNRPKDFPQSIGLIGVRDVRDYRIWSEIKEQIILGGSAFNIKDESIRLADFSQEEVAQLYSQHTHETGQLFNDDAITYAFEQTQGQPWLVNALAYQVCFELVTDRTKTITKKDMELAKEIIIARQDTHLDALVDRLHEPRIRTIIDAIIKSAEHAPIINNDDDIAYAQDLGLIKVTASSITIANPIYQEILPRILTTKFQRAMAGQSIDYIDGKNILNMHKLLEKFTLFYRENAQIWLEQFDYKESGPHLILMAFLQRIINGGGRIHREYALGRKRVDLLIEWKIQKIVLELKIFKDNNTLPEGLIQTANYMDSSNASEGHLIIFNKNPHKSWQEKIYQKQEIVDGKTIFVWGL